MKIKYLILVLACFILNNAKTQTYNYAEALQKSLYFYDAEKCGPGVTGLRLTWRGDCHVIDKVLPLNEEMTNMSASFISANRTILDPDGNGTLDVSGGYHDAGDHVQFGLPQTYSSSNLEWALYEFRDAFVKTGELAHMNEILRWASDYYLKCTYLNSSGNVVAFCYQVGEGNVDHNFWGPPELSDTKIYPRPAYFATSEAPASDQCAGAAASLAISYLNNKTVDLTYANKCLTVAKALYKFAVQYRGLGYSGGFYNSSFDEDELAWAAIWLHIASGEASYLNDITSINAEGKYTGWLGKIIISTQDQWQNIWVHSWDTKWGGVFAKLAPITNDPFHWWIFRWNLEYWSAVPHQNSSEGGFLSTTPAGFSFLNSWGSARYNAAAQMQGMVYKKYANSSVFDAWMTNQMQYIMGKNPLNRSYIVGYSDNYAEHPHHRAAHGSPNNSMFDPPNHKHILWGALVGGPGAEDEHNDETRDFIYNEVAIDYNAGLVGALAGHYYYFGEGQLPVANFPPADPPLVEYKIETKIEQENIERSQISIRVTNESAFPPRIDIPITARYYFNISEMMQFNQTIADVKKAIYYDQIASTGDSVTITGPIANDAANGEYYLEFKWPDSGFYGSRELQFGLIADQDANFTTHWDPTNDYSHLDLTTSYIDNGKVPLYANAKLVAGAIPEGGTIISVTGVSVNPATLTIAMGQTSALTATVTPTNATNKSVSWSSSNTAVATVNSVGVVTGIALGTVSITATTVDGLKTATSLITVSDIAIKVTGVSITPATVQVNSGSTTALIATVAPSNATNKNVTWSSSNTAIATVNSLGVVTGVAAGTATITVTTVDGAKTANSIVTVGTIATPCTNPVAISLPFIQNGVGEYCWTTSGTITYVNSWNMDLVEVNGVVFTNKWAGNMPAKIDGLYYIHYKSSVAWAHMEVNGTGGGNENIAVTGVTIDPTNNIVHVGYSTLLTATVLPTNATNKNVAWSSSNSAVATVSSIGDVKGISNGSATITVTTEDGSKIASVIMTVTSAATGITVFPTNATISTGATTTLSATLIPDFSTSLYTWSSANTAVATVNSAGVVTGISSGTTTIKATLVDGGIFATCTVVVTPGPESPVTGISVSPTALNVPVGSIGKLTETITPANAVNKSVVWSSSNSAVAIVNSTGIVTGVANGTAIITVTSVDGNYKATSAITVSGNGVLSVTLSPSTVITNINTSTQLTATILPTTATNKNVSWSSSNSLVATVSSTGIVTGVAIGTATITATSQIDMRVGTCVVTVNTTIIPIEIIMAPTTVTMSLGSTAVLTANILPANATNKTILWSTSNSSVATVNSTGVVTGVGEGVATITATAAANGISVSGLVTVVSQPVTPCSSPVAITIPFSQNGIGEYCWSTTQGMSYVNSWNMDLVEVNGVDLTNVWSNNIPAAIGGIWYIHYKATVSWAHFEAPALKDANGIEMSQNVDVKVYPNPFSSTINIELNGSIDIRRIELYNSLGQIIKLIDQNQFDSKKLTIDLNFPGNLFYLKIETDQQTIVKTLIKE